MNILNPEHQDELPGYNTVNLVVYWLTVYMVVVSFPMFLAPLVGPESYFKYVHAWFPLFYYLKSPGASFVIAKICIAAGILDIFFISNFMDRYDRLWYWMRVVILVAVAFPYLYIFNAYFSCWFDTLFQSSVPVSVQ